MFHARVHSDMNPKCDKCGKQFAAKSSLEEHKFVHTGEMPHQCEECGKKYRLKKSLAAHVKRHHREVPEYRPLSEEQLYEMERRKGSLNSFFEFK